MKVSGFEGFSGGWVFSGVTIWIMSARWSLSYANVCFFFCFLDSERLFWYYLSIGRWKHRYSGKMVLELGWYLIRILMRWQLPSFRGRILDCCFVRLYNFYARRLGLRLRGRMCRSCLDWVRRIVYSVLPWIFLCVQFLRPRRCFQWGWYCGLHDLFLLMCALLFVLLLLLKCVIFRITDYFLLRWLYLHLFDYLVCRILCHTLLFSVCVFVWVRLLKLKLCRCCGSIWSFIILHV